MSNWPKDRVFNNGKELVDFLRTNYSSYIKSNITELHVHHTWSPNHSSKGSTLALHQNIRKYHVKSRGWSDIGEHLTIGKDGLAAAGRDIKRAPASATGHNGGTRHPFMFEMIGNFDKGNDKLEGAQLDTVLALAHFFHVEMGKPIKFHREMGPKTCPGTGIDKAAFVKQAKNYDPNRGVGSVTTAPAKPSKPAGANVGGSIVDYLKAHNENSSLSNRKKLAVEHNISNYSGTAAQNTKLLESMKKNGIHPKKAAKHKYNMPNRVLKVTKPQMHGADVREYQEALASLYFYPDKGAKNNGADGYYGPKSANATKRFQSYYGLVVDGHAGPATKRKLDSLVNK